MQESYKGQDNFGELLGVQVLVADEDRVKVRTVVRPEHTNAYGTAHGGFLYSLADVAFAKASNTEDLGGVAINTHMESYRPAEVGEALIAESHGENIAKRLATYKIQLCRERDGAPIASFTGTAYLLRNELAVPSEVSTADAGSREQ